MKCVLVTWSSGFIGYHLCSRLLHDGYKVVGLDSENDYYDVELKRARRKLLENNENFVFYHTYLEDFEGLSSIFTSYTIDYVVNLAAFAGVRYSMKTPFPYIQANIVWFHNILELSKNHWVRNFVYASSASVYWANTPPFSEENKTDSPLSLYGATKKAGELIAHSYSSLYGIKTTWLRFFNVLWPWWRPDGSLFLFVDHIVKGKPIQLFNYGKMKRNFTYIDDIIDATVKSLDSPALYDIFNLANDNIVDLHYFVERIEFELGKKAEIELVPIQPWEIEESRVNIQHTKSVLSWSPYTNIEDMVRLFVLRYKEFYNI